ncbi:hypothetical protein A3L11_07245 [Thermococcus siculi]|uniref:Glycosyltransferase RgtA/B/C/D-like domain-containing protein n=2 Tax=Thermococcus siculi TaxID=72803 RepID=A0A2Z2MY25_9EURY|nr:hypothetical protein A3L11_07245 [Thermococcus siculi]
MLLSLLLFSISKIAVYIAPLMILFLGFNVSRFLFRDVSYRIAISPAIGMSLLSIVSYILSLSGIGLKPLVYVVLILSAVSFDIGDVYILTNLNQQEKVLLGKLILTVIAVVGVRAIVFKMPTDNVDNYFHATKILYTLRYMTIFPPKVPVFNLFTYPAGYHILVSFVIMVSQDLIPHAMLVVRIWSWVFITLGTYLFGAIWFEKRVGLYSAMLILVTNIYTYYLLVFINPNFIGFYFFLVLLALFYVEINEMYSELVSPLGLWVLMIIIGAGVLFVHPYEFQNWVFVISVYLLLKVLSGEVSIKTAFLRGMIYVVPPILIYAILNPYFWRPELASGVVIEYPWASYVGVVVKHLSVFTGKNPMDTWSKFWLLIKWVTVRNYNYLATFLLFIGGIWALHKRNHVREVVSLGVFVFFVLLLVLNRLTYNIPVPFFGTAAMERIFLWLSPLFPVFISLGLILLIEWLMENFNSNYSRVIVILMLLLLYIVPSVGIAHDLIADEANFYVDHSNLEDFDWLDARFSNVTILNSCYRDSGSWIQFFTSNRVIFSHLNRCRFGQVTPLDAEKMVRIGLRPLNATLAYIDTNYPSLDPLVFYRDYKLLRFNNGNWIFDLRSRDTKNNLEVLSSGLRLCNNVISGNTDVDGQYYVYGFRKKYFWIEYLYLQGLNYAWLEGDRGVIMFVPCESYSRVSLYIVLPGDRYLNVTISINGDIHRVQLSPGVNPLSFNVALIQGSLVTIEIYKNCDCLLLVGPIRLE